MRETGDVLYESGHVVDVTVVTLGDELNGDHANGATTLTVGDSVDFDSRCVVLIDGVTYNVTDVDDDTNTLTISPGLAGAKDDGETIELWDPLYQVVSSYKSVQVRVLSEDSNEDIVEAVLAMHLIDKLEEGLRGGRGESVLLEMDGDEWRVVDVLGFGDPEAGVGLGTKFWQDEHTIAAAGDQQIVLTHVPIPYSEHVYWIGLYQPGSEWSRDGRTLTISDPDEVLEVDDTITVEYAFRSGPQGPPMDGVDYGATGWSYLFVTLADTTDRSDPSFDDSSWSVGQLPIGNNLGTYTFDGETWLARQVAWSTETGVWIRRRLEGRPSGTVTINAHVDNTAIFYWNGSVIGTGGLDGVPSNVGPFTVDPSLISDTNVLAVHVKDDVAVAGGDGTHIDVEVTIA